MLGGPSSESRATRSKYGCRLKKNVELALADRKIERREGRFKSSKATAK